MNKNNNTKVYKIFLGESIPSLNKGEEAIFQGLKQTLIKHFGAVEIKLLTNNFKMDKRVYKKRDGIELITKKNTKSSIKYNLIYSFWIIIYILCEKKTLKWIKNSFIKALLECDLYLVGHDNLFSSEKLSFGLLKNLIVLRFLKKPTAVCVGSFGPFGGNKAEKLAAKILKLFNVVLLRDQFSYNYALKLYNNSDKILLVPDLAFLLPCGDRNEAKKVFGSYNIPLYRPIIGFTIATKSVVTNNACLSTGKSFEERKKMHHMIIADTIKHIQKKYDVSIVFLPHCIETAKGNDDRISSKEIISLLPDKKNVWLIEKDCNASLLKSMISEMDLLVAERTHSAIGAASVLTPFISVAYPNDFRTYGIIGKMLNLENCLYDIRNLEKESLCNLIDYCWGNRISLKEKLKKIIPTILLEADHTGKHLFDIVNHYNF